MSPEEILRTDGNDLIVLIVVLVLVVWLLWFILERVITVFSRHRNKVK